MAKPTGSNGSGHNHDQRLKALGDAIEEWCTLQDEEDAAIAEHVKPIREKKQTLKSRATKDHEIPTEAFNARAALRRIERMKDNDEVVVALNDLFKATPVGHNIDLEAVIARVAKAKADKAAKASTATTTEAAV